MSHGRRPQPSTTRAREKLGDPHHLTRQPRELGFVPIRLEPDGLTDEGAERPAVDLALALNERGVDRRRFLATRPGQVWSAPTKS